MPATKRNVYLRCYLCHVSFALGVSLGVMLCDDTVIPIDTSVNGLEFFRTELTVDGETFNKVSGIHSVDLCPKCAQYIHNKLTDIMENFDVNKRDLELNKERIK